MLVSTQNANFNDQFYVRKRFFAKQNIRQIQNIKSHVSENVISDKVTPFLWLNKPYKRKEHSKKTIFIIYFTVESL